MSKFRNRSLSLGDIDYLSEAEGKSPIKIEPKNDLNVLSTINISKNPEKDQLDITVLQDNIRKVLQDTIKSDHSIRNINMKIEVITTTVTRKEVEKLSEDRGSEFEIPKIVINAEEKKELEEDNVSTISSLVALTDSPKSSKSTGSHIDDSIENRNPFVEQLSEQSSTHLRNCSSEISTIENIDALESNDLRKTKTTAILEDLSNSKISPPKENEGSGNLDNSQLRPEENKDIVRIPTEEEPTVPDDRLIQRCQTLTRTCEEIVSVEHTEHVKDVDEQRKLTDLSGSNLEDSTADIIDKSNQKCESPIRNGSCVVGESTKDLNTDIPEELRDLTESHLMPSENSLDTDNEDCSTEVATAPPKHERKSRSRFRKLSERTPSRKLPSRKCKGNDSTQVDSITDSQTIGPEKNLDKLITNMQFVHPVESVDFEDLSADLPVENCCSQTDTEILSSENITVTYDCRLGSKDSLKEFGITKDIHVILSPLDLENMQEAIDSSEDSPESPIENTPKTELATKIMSFESLELKNVAESERNSEIILKKVIQQASSSPKNRPESEIVIPKLPDTSTKTKFARRNSVSDLTETKIYQKTPLSRSKSLGYFTEENCYFNFEFKDIASSMLDVFTPMRITRSKVPTESQKSTENMNSVLNIEKRSNSIKRSQTAMARLFNSHDSNIEELNQSEISFENQESKQLPAAVSETASLHNDDDEENLLSRLEKLKNLLSNDDQISSNDDEVRKINKYKRQRDRSESPEDRNKYQRLTRSRSVGRNICSKDSGGPANALQEESDDEFYTSASVGRKLRSKSVPRKVLQDCQKSTDKRSTLRSKSVPRRSLRSRLEKDMNESLDKNVRRERSDKSCEADKQDINSDDCLYKMGSFVWAQIGKFPFWPAMVCEDPVESTFVMKSPSSLYKNVTYKYHVRFFNDNGKRAWIPENHLMMYCTKDDLTEMTEKLQKLNMRSCTRYLKPKHPRVYRSWNQAVEELELLKQKNSNEVYHHLVDSYVKHYHKTHKKISSEEAGPLLSIENPEFTIENSDESHKIGNEESSLENCVKSNKTENGESISHEVLPETKVSSEEVKQYPSIKIKIKLDSSGLHSELSTSVNEVVIEKDKPNKHKNRSKNHDVSKSFQNTSPSEVSTRKLRNSWPATVKNQVVPQFDFIRPSPSENLKKKRQSHHNVEVSDSESVWSKRKRTQEKEVCDSEAKTHSESTEVEMHSEPTGTKLHSGPSEEKTQSEPKEIIIEPSDENKYSFEYQVELHKKNNPFNGLSRTKVCHYCLKPEKVFRCRGKCGGYFHVECASKVMSPRPQYKTSKQLKKPRRSGSSTAAGIPATSSEKGVKTSDTESSCSSLSSDKVQIVDVHSKCLTNLSNPTISGLPPTFNELTLDEQIDDRMKEVMSRFDEQVTYADSSSTDTSSEDGSDISLAEKRLGYLRKTSFAKKCNAENYKFNEKNGETTASSKNLLVLDGILSPPIILPKEKVVKHVTADSIIIDDGIDPANFKCEYCRLDKYPSCSVCESEVSPKGIAVVHKCSQYHCNKTYHKSCLKMWPQAQWSIGKWTKDQNSQDMFTCPSHVCHTCFSEELGAGSVRLPGDKLAKCLLCPASYHASTFCLPAGSEVLGASQLICPRHRKNTQPLNTIWCFICSEGGNLVCCDMCPTSVHPECQPVNVTDDDKYICEDCESGRFPLYDEVVWVKLGSYRWWPALVLFPNEVPINMLSLKHQIGDFAVRFFGTNDHYWVSRSRSFLFQEGDRGGSPEESLPSKKSVYKLFDRAIEDAARAYQAKKDFKLRREAESITSLKPPSYVKTVKNKPIGNVKPLELDLSNTTACECDPEGPNPCGPETDCINRLLLTECDPELCPANTRCRNQSFEKREYPPMVPYKTQGRGWGLRNLALIKKGQFVIEYVGDLIDQEEYQRRIKKMHETKEENYYFMTLDNDRMIDAGPKGNISRFMNHSCNPNCETQKWTVKGDTRVGLFAMKDIDAGSELTFNYNLECVGQEKKTCKCGAPNCSGFIGVKAKPEQDSDSSLKPIIKIKKSSKTRAEVAPLPTCFICNRKGGYTICCTNKLCNKNYHSKCLQLNDKTDLSKYVCPRHNCNLCTNRTIRCCVKCINSFCPSHSEGNVRHDKLSGFVCRLHDPQNRPSSHKKNSDERYSVKLKTRKRKQYDLSCSDESCSKKTNFGTSTSETVESNANFNKRMNRKDRNMFEASSSKRASRISVKKSKTVNTNDEMSSSSSEAKEDGANEAETRLSETFNGKTNGFEDTEENKSEKFHNKEMDANLKKIKRDTRESNSFLATSKRVSRSRMKKSNTLNTNDEMSSSPIEVKEDGANEVENPVSETFKSKTNNFEDIKLTKKEFNPKKCKNDEIDVNLKKIKKDTKANKRVSRSSIKKSNTLKTNDEMSSISSEVKEDGANGVETLLSETFHGKTNNFKDIKLPAEEFHSKKSQNNETDDNLRKRESNLINERISKSSVKLSAGENNVYMAHNCNFNNVLESSNPDVSNKESEDLNSNRQTVCHERRRVLRSSLNNFREFDIKELSLPEEFSKRIPRSSLNVPTESDNNMSIDKESDVVTNGSGGIINSSEAPNKEGSSHLAEHGTEGTECAVEEEQQSNVKKV